jgi:hypothetical protein
VGRPDEDGAILILALVFVLVVTTAIFGLITFGGAGIMNATNLKGQRSLEYAADGAATAAIQAVRYSYLPFGYPPVDCLPDGAILTINPPDNVTMTINGDQMVVDCAASILPPNYPPQPQGRVIAFYACQQADLTGSPLACYSGNAIVAVTVAFQDTSSAGVYECSTPTNTATCGTGESIISWDVQTAND